MHNTKLPFTIEKRGDHICGRFSAMASPCEILVDSTDTNLAKKLTKMAYTETKRIEKECKMLEDRHKRITELINQARPFKNGGY